MMKELVLRNWFTYISVCLLCMMNAETLMAQAMSEDEVRTVTLNLQKASLPDILGEIEKQTGVTFSYESSLLKEFQKTSFKVKNEKLSDCLKRLFANYPISYKLTGNIVVLKRKQKQVTISGFVRDESSAESLIGASVYDQGSHRGVATNSYGFFSLSLPLPAQQESLSVRIHSSYIGYEGQTFIFPALSGDTLLSINLKPNASIGEVLITGTETARATVHNTQMGALEVNQATLKATPTLFGESDIIRTLQLTPGVSSGTEGISGLYVRGGNSDENLFLIDGNPVYQVNHLGGLFSAFNSDAIKEMDFYKAGFPARYGGRLSSVVDVKTKEGNMKEYHGSATLGLIAGNLSLEGPIIKDRTSFQIALRRTWLDVITAPAFAIVNKKEKDSGSTIGGRYAFHDLNARIDHRFSDKSRLYVSLYNGNDVLKAKYSDAPSKGYENVYSESNDSYMRWGNLVASAGWTYAFNSKLFGKLSGFYTRYSSKINYKYKRTLGWEGHDDYLEIHDEATNVAGITDFGIRTSFDYQPLSNHHIRFGGDYLIHYFQPEYNHIKALDTDQPDSMQISKTISDSKLWAHELSVYGEDDWTLSEAFRLNAGLRFSLFNIEHKTYAGVEPRVSLRWLLSPQISLKASYARMNQYVHLISNSYMNLPTDSWMPVTRKLKPLISDQVSLGGYYNWNQMLDFSIEGYYKKMNNLLEYKDGYSLVPSMVSWEDKMASGEGHAYGLEFMVRKQAGRTTGWIGYALSWADRRFDEINNGKRYPSRYDNRHKLNIVVMHKLTKNIELSAAWTYSSGNYTTLSLENYQGGTLHKPGDNAYTNDLNYYDGRNNFQLPAYHRLDLGVNFYRPKKNGRMGIWNVTLYNAYCRMNYMMVHKTSAFDYIDENGNYHSKPVFKMIGFLPIIPSVSYTYKF